MNEPEAFTLRKPVPADPYLPAPGPPAWVWAAAAFAVALFAAALVMAIRRRRKRRAASGPDVEKARRRALAELSTILPTAPAREVATQVSLVLRRFLSEALGDPVLFETHEEFISRRDALANIPAGQRDALAKLFDTLVAFKYSPVPPGTDAAPFLDQAGRLLASLEILPPPEEPEKPKSPEPPPLPPSLPNKKTPGKIRPRA